MPSAARVHYIQFLIQYSSIALLYYDYVLTFGSEIKLMWGRKFRVSTLLYIFCRYALVANVIYLLAVAKKLTKKTPVFCDMWYQLIAAISLLGRAAVIFTLGARTYAVFSCNRYILAVVSLMGLTCIGLSIVHVPGAKCVGANDNEKYSGEANAILTTVYEVLVAALTLFRGMQEYRANGGSWKGQGHGLYSLIFEQGLIYFCIVSIFTTLTIVLNFTQPPGTFFQRLVNALTLPVSCLLTARFLLQLREWQEKDTFTSTSLPGLQSIGGGGEQVATLPPPNFAANWDAFVLNDFGNHDQIVSRSSGPTDSSDETRVQEHDLEEGSSRDTISMREM